MVKAAVLYNPNSLMVVEDLSQQDPKYGEVRVQIGAAGICASDHHVMLGQATVPLPIVLGHEGSGIVESVGAGVESIGPGDRCVLSFVSNCGHCRSCNFGFPNLCDMNRLSGTRQYDNTLRLTNANGVEVHQFTKLGVFAEKIVIPAQACHKIPDSVPMDVACLIGCSVTTGVGAVINQPSIRPGSTVAVFGAGGVGLNTIQGARLINAERIITIDIYDHKLEFAYKFGATDVVNARNTDPVTFIKKLTNGRGVDFGFDTYGSDVTTEQMVKVVAKGGTGVIVGLAPEGVNAGIDMVDMVRNQKSLVGSYYGTTSPHETFSKLIEFYLKGRIDVDNLITRRYSLEDINVAYDALANGEDGRGVIIFPEVN